VPFAASITRTGAADKDEPLAKARRAAKLDAAAGKSVDRIRLELKSVS
jgi:hypothetical protein